MSRFLHHAHFTILDFVHCVKLYDVNMPFPSGTRPFAILFQLHGTGFILFNNIVDTNFFLTWSFLEQA